MSYFTTSQEAAEDLSRRRHYSGDPDRGGTAMLERCWPLIASLERQLVEARQSLFEAGTATGEYLRGIEALEHDLNARLQKLMALCRQAAEDASERDHPAAARLLRLAARAVDDAHTTVVAALDPDESEFRPDAQP